MLYCIKLLVEQAGKIKEHARLEAYRGATGRLCRLAFVSFKGQNLGQITLGKAGNISEHLNEGRLEHLNSSPRPTK